MKRILKKLKFRSPDEMEQAILFKAQRNAYLSLVIALLAWSFYESFQVYATHARLNPVPGLLLGMAAVIQAVSQLVMTRNAVKDDEDSYETGPLFRIIVLTCAVIGVLATAVSAVILMGVKA